MEEAAGVAPGRSPPQIHASEEGSGMDGRRSPRLHPQTQAGEEGAGVTCHRSPRLHPQTQEGEDDGGVTCRRSPRLHPEGTGVTSGRILCRRGKSPAVAVSLPDDDDMLREILIRLPPRPSSLPRASAVCKRWRGLVRDAKFQRQFRAHHRNPPLLGAFVWSDDEIVFTPALDPPDRIPPQRFHLGRYSRGNFQALLDCRHGLVLIKHWEGKLVVVCDPITGEHRSVAAPPDFDFVFLSGTVLCAAGDLGHVHGSCHSSPFKVVLMSICRKDKRHIARVYSSETGIWGNLISVEAEYLFPATPTVLVGNCLYWLSIEDDILEFNLDEASLSVIRGPPAITRNEKRQIIRAEDGAVGYAVLSYPCLQMWQRNINAHGVATWVPWKTIEMDTILGLPPLIQGEMGGNEMIRGYDEDTDVIFLDVKGNIYMVQLKSMQSRKLDKTIDPSHYHPFKSFYTPAIREGDEAELLHGQ